MPGKQRSEHLDITGLELSASFVEIDGYDIGEILGIGGFGVVLAAVRQSDGRAVAIKTVHRDDPAAWERLLCEAAALRAIGTPFVPALYEEGRCWDGTPYFVFERLQLPRLSALLGQPIAPVVVIDMADAILTALDAAHGKGFVHRDIKPDNIFIDQDRGRAKLIDFGLVMSPGAPVAPARDTLEGLILGTPLYMSPEQCMGQGEVDPRSDIYSIGVVLYEMLTGCTPFSGDVAQVRVAHVSRRPPPPSQLAAVPPGLADIVLRCLAKAPEHRFSGAAELKDALRSDSAIGRCAPRRASLGECQSAEQGAADRGGTGRSALSMARSIMAGLLFFEPLVDTATVLGFVAARGGHVIGVTGRRCVAVVGLDKSGEPVDHALEAAQAALEQKIAARVTVHRERVRVLAGRSGRVHIASAAWRNHAYVPRPEDPPGLLFTASAAALLSDFRTAALPGRGELLQSLGPFAGDEGADDGVVLGRDREMAELCAGARAVLERNVAGLATVLGDAGYGKSHLLGPLVTELGSAGFCVMEMRAREPVGGDRDEILQTLLRRALDVPADAMGDADRVRSLVMERLGQEIGEEVWPAVALLCGWLPGDAPEVSRLKAAPSALRSAAARAAGEALRALAQKGPVCCILDDAHFADEITLDALEYATLAEADVPLWVCVLARPSFLRARPFWGRRASNATAVFLGPLPDDSAAALCRRLLRPAENVPDKVVGALLQKTEANPLLLIEIARAIKGHGLIRRHSRGSSWYVAADEIMRLSDLPRVEWLAEREITALPRDLAAHARLLALLGAELTVAEVEGVLRELEADGLGQEFPLDAWVATRRLCDRGLVSERDMGHVGFRHGILREHVAQLMSRGLREHVHRAAFRYYSRGIGVVTEVRRLPLLAHHAAHSGSAEPAAELYLDLAARACDCHKYVEAEALYSRAVELIPAGRRRGRLDALRGRGLMRYRLSRFQDALDDLFVARAMAEGFGDKALVAEILLDEATVLDWMRDFLASRHLVEQACEVAPKPAPPLLAARLSLGHGRALFRTGDRVLARNLLEQAAARAEALGDPGYETRVIALMLLGYMLGSDLELVRAHEVFAQCIALCAERGDKLHLAAVLNNRRELWIGQNDIEGAVRDGRWSQQIGREIGQIGIEYVTSFNLAELHYYAGDWKSAWPHVLRAVEIEPSCAPKPLARLLQARLHLFSGHYEQAEPVLADIRTQCDRAAGQGDAEAMLAEAENVLLAMVELALGTAVPGNPGHDAWDALLGRAEKVSPLIECIEVMEAAALSAAGSGDAARARALLDRALALGAELSHPIMERVRKHRGDSVL